MTADFKMSQTVTKEEDAKVYTLTVPNYSSNLVTELNSLRTNNICCDVRICTEEGFLYAHKIVLSAMSPYFKERVCLASNGQVDVYLEDTSLDLIKSLLDFIYTGTLIFECTMIDSMLQLLNKIDISNIQKLCENLANKVAHDSEKNVKPTLDKIKDSLKTSHVDKQKAMRRQRKGKPSKLTGISDKNATEDLNMELDDSERKSQRKERLLVVCKKVEKHNYKDLPDVDKGDDESRAGLSKKSKKQTVVKGKQKRKSRSSGVKQKSISSKKSLARIQDLDKQIKHDSNEAAISDTNDLDVSEDLNMAIDTTESNDATLNDVIMESLDSQGNTDVKNVTDKIYYNEVRKNKGEVTKQCKVCYVSFSSGKEYTDHIKTCKKDTTKVCKLCNMALPTHKEYLSHLKVHRDENGGKLKRIRTPWPCSVCDKILTSSVRKACHEYSKHGIPFESKFKLFSCPVEGCKYISASKHYIEIHTRGRHSNERPHVCEYCGKGFKLPSALATHINIHTKQKKFECEECQLTFHQKGGLDIHIKKHHMGEQSWSELCDLCSEKFLHKAELCWHLYVAHGQPLPDRYTVFTCDLCDYKTIRKNKLDRHMDAHEDRRPWTCNICGKKFVTKSYLNRHIKYHGEKKFVCDYEGCSYASVDKIGLRKHVRLIHTHKNLKPYSCSICSYKTALQGNLDKHIVLHLYVNLNLKPYSCSICSYKTALRGNLDKHIRSVHNLEVVTKHTVHMKVKFKDREAGDIITKEGELVQSAKQREKTNNHKSSYNFAEDFSLYNAVERMSKKCEILDHSDDAGMADEQRAIHNSYMEESHSPSDITANDDETTKQYKEQQQQFVHQQNLEPNISSQVQYHFPVAVNNRMMLANQSATHQSEFYRSMDQLQMYKYQIMNPYSECQ